MHRVALEKGDWVRVDEAHPDKGLAGKEGTVIEYYPVEAEVYVEWDHPYRAPDGSRKHKSTVNYSFLRKTGESGMPRHYKSNRCANCNRRIAGEGSFEKIKQMKRDEAMRDVDEVDRNREWAVQMGSRDVKVRRDTPGGYKYSVSFGDGTSEVVTAPPDGMISSKGYVGRKKSQLAIDAVKKVQTYRKVW